MTNILPQPPSPVRLDRTDCAILTALQKNAGLSNKELAARVKLAPSSCLERVRRLRASGVLKGMHAEVSAKAVGVELQAIIAVRVNTHEDRKVVELTEHLMAHPEVVTLYYLAGRTDFLVHVAVRDVEHLRAFSARTVASSKTVDSVETSLIFDHRRSPVLPNYVEDRERR